MVTLFYCIVAYLSIINSQPPTDIVPFNDLMVGDYIIITRTLGGYLKDNEDGTLISSSTFDDTAIWEVTDDFPVTGIEFKNTKTGNYMKGDGTNCKVGSFTGAGGAGSWTQVISGTFKNNKQKCCCVDSADDTTITHGLCDDSCAKLFEFHVISVPSLILQHGTLAMNTKITSFANLVVDDNVIIESATGFGGYLTDNEDGSTLTNSAFDLNSIWVITDDFSSEGIEFKNIITANYIKGDNTNCYVGLLQHSGNWGGWTQSVSGTFKNDLHGKCCCVDSADDTTITHGLCNNNCAQFVFHVILSVGSCT